MIISLFGYGKMGKEIEQIAVQRGHQIGLKINSSNSSDITKENVKNTDVIIEFSRPEFAKDNILFAIENNVPIVVGTTGWYEDYDFLKSQVLEKSGTLLTATNFSVGVNIFFKINEYLAKIMNTQDAYDVHMKEIHHTQKLDAPSGTALTLAQQIIHNIDRKTKWTDKKTLDKSELTITSERVDPAPGTHSITYTSEIDDIEITHTAHNRKGFAFGSVLAAEFVKDKKGIFTMNDVLQF
jgi:4-hydroxy-tetrahydrodipicolinate reductase